MPVFNTFLCKVASRCNLNCSYCYMYHHADQSWRARPKFMSPQTIDAFASRLAEYVASSGLKAVTVLLHGGEPLLAGKERIEHFLQTIVTALKNSKCVVEFSMQTNSTLLNTE